MAKGVFTDLKGQRFGRLLVCRRSFEYKGSKKGAYWICKCDCGKGCIVRASSLVRGQTRSCGCLRSESSRITIQKCRDMRGKSHKDTTSQV